MWGNNFSFKEGTAIGCGLIATGLMLQFSVGSINWQLTAWPANAMLLALIVVMLVAMHLLRKRVYLFRWLSTHTSAISSMAFTVVVTVILGLIAQSSSPEAPWWNRLLSSWPFVLVYMWLTVSLGLTILRVGSHRWTWRTCAFMLNHLGLFIALTTATLGNADMQRLKMSVGQNALGYGPQAIAYDELSGDSATVEMDFALTLNKFTIDQYPAKLAVIDSLGQTLPEGQPQQLVIEDSLASGHLLGWDVQVLKSLDTAAKMQRPDPNDSTQMVANYVPMQLGGTTALREGGAYAVYVKATNAQSGENREGWVSCGSFLPFSFSVLPLDDCHSIAMLQREPRKYTSHVTVYVREGDDARCLGDTIIEVNRPIEVNGWKIYQLSYEEQYGPATRYSVFELVRDPWLPWVYAGILMMLAGAITLFFTSNPKTRKP